MSWKEFLCKIGIHKWKNETVHAYGTYCDFGDRCVRCGVWNL